MRLDYAYHMITDYTLTDTFPSQLRMGIETYIKMKYLSYNDVILSAMVSQITSLAIVY